MEKKIILGMLLGLFLIAAIPAIDAVQCSINATFATGYIIKGDGNPTTNLTGNCSGQLAGEEIRNMSCFYKPTGASSFYQNSTAMPIDHNESAADNQTLFGSKWNLSKMGFDKKIDIYCKFGCHNNTVVNTSVVTGIIINNTGLGITSTAPVDATENENGTITWTCTADEESTTMTLNYNNGNFAMTGDARKLVYTVTKTHQPDGVYEWRCTGADTDATYTPSSSYNTLMIDVKGLGTRIPPQIIADQASGAPGAGMDPIIVVVILIAGWFLLRKK